MKKTDPLYDVKSTFYRRDLSTPYRYRTIILLFISIFLIIRNVRPFNISIRRIRVCVSDNENTRLLLAFLRVVEADRYVEITCFIFHFLVLCNIVVFISCRRCSQCIIASTLFDAY